MTDVLDVLVVGGGIVGLACARELALAGLSVELLERRGAGAEASLAAAGMLSPLAELVPGPLLDACRESRDLWLSWVPALVEETGLSIEHDTSGSLLVALDADDEAWLDELAATAAGLGEITDEIELSGLARLVPDVSPAVRRALLVHGDHRVDNVQACAVLAIAAQRAGAKLTYGVEVERVERAEDGGVRVVTRDGAREAGRLVLAAGAWSGRIPGLPELPVRPVRGQMLLAAGVAWPWTGCLRGRHGYAVRRGETGLLIGATVEEAGFAAHPTVGGVGGLLAFAHRVLPGLAEARLETTWAGLRPGTPDDLPIVGEIPGWPVVAATGHYRNGILLAPWTARAVARLILSGEAPEAAPFRPERLRTEI
jgi:glycine oxidase